MTNSLQLLRHNTFVLTAVVTLFSACAYYNTFYNAEQYYEKGEKLRLEKTGESLPPMALDAYGKVAEKCQYVLDKYPNSRYYPEALFLKGKAHFHRKEFRIAEIVFNQYLEQFKLDQLEVEYWLALCKWKLGKPQPALEDLMGITDVTNDQSFLSKVYLGIAEIHLENKDSEAAMENLELAAETNRERDERGQIYYRMADLAYSNQDYTRALGAYQKLIKNTSSKKIKEEATLLIVRINRQMGNWDKVQDLIKTMLVDEMYMSIHGDLELELVKLYQMNNQNEEAVSRLESIKEEYKDTKTSAEAYYIHGEIELYQNRNLDKAQEYFGQVTREFGQSPFTKTANLHNKEITEYQQSLLDIAQLEEQLIAIVSELDSVGNDSIIAFRNDEMSSLTNSIAGHLYVLGELEAFHFKRPDSAQIFFQQIIDEIPESNEYPKALFTMYYLNNLLGDTVKANYFSEMILADKPMSEYADYLRKELELPVDSDSPQALLRRGEMEWLINPDVALKLYKGILKLDLTSETSARAAYFLAFNYDYTFYEPDSALKYYTWLHKYHGNSEQTQASKIRYDTLKQLQTITKSDTLDN